MKKIYFDGCSYTFGQGLELYCNSLDKFEPNRMSHYRFTNDDMQFISKNRYSGIVSNHFGFKEINKSFNGKSNGNILNTLKNENIDEYEYFIIQLTHFNRYFMNGVEWHGQPDTIDYLLKNKILSEDIINYTINNVDKIQYEYYLELALLFKNYPNKLKIIFHSNEWEDILTKEEIEKYGISANGYHMIRKWAYNRMLFINQQEEFRYNPATKGDSHLILEGHKLLAKSIIEQL